MNRFKRIAHRGWLGSSVSLLTAGYYPVSDEELGKRPIFIVFGSRLFMFSKKRI